MPTWQRDALANGKPGNDQPSGHKVKKGPGIDETKLDEASPPFLGP